MPNRNPLNDPANKTPIRIGILLSAIVAVTGIIGGALILQTASTPAWTAVAAIATVYFTASFRGFVTGKVDAWRRDL